MVIKLILKDSDNQTRVLPLSFLTKAPKLISTI